VRIVTILSLLALIGTAGMWVRSQFALEYLAHHREVGSGEPARVVVWAMASSRGSVWFEHSSLVLNALPPERLIEMKQDLKAHSGFARARFEPQPLLEALPNMRPGDAEGCWGFAWMTDHFTAGNGRTAARSFNGRWYMIKQRDDTGIAIPWWFLTVLLSIAPGLAFLRWRRSKLDRTGHCVGCGYDLRASPEPTGTLLATCPECGRPSQGTVKDPGRSRI
jgi:hypothetical protein